MKLPPRKTSCPVCVKEDNSRIVFFENMPLFCNVLHPSAKEARSVAKGDIDLVLCNNCLHVYNAQFDPDKISYQTGYENSLFYSTRYQNYAEKQAKRLIDRYYLSTKAIIDIGCGTGGFLQLLCHMGSCSVTGFEPSAESNQTGEEHTVNIIADTFGPKYFDIPADCYIARHVLEHLSDPTAFLQTIALAIGHKASPLFLEVPNGAFMLEQCSVFDVIYEHYSYFTPSSLKYLLDRVGFQRGPVKPGFGGQYLYVDCLSSSSVLQESDLPSRSCRDVLLRVVDNFVISSRKVYNRVEKLISELNYEGKNVLWGAGSKGITLMNQLTAPERIDYLVDINPAKQGKCIPGTAHKVVSPEFLTSFQPDTVLITNSIYRQEIQQHLDALKVAAKIYSL